LKSETENEMKILDLEVMSEGQSFPLKLRVRRMVNAGYVGRNLNAIEAHIEELRREGIPPPPSVPMIFPVLSHNITTENQIEVIGNRTSGEVEFVLLLEGETVFVGVGSDHTDRDLERQSIVKSKQICLNVLSPRVWKYEEVKSHWDELLMQSWVRMDQEDADMLYQRAHLKSIISAADLQELVKSRMGDVPDGESGLVIFSGTIPILTKDILYGSYFRGELMDSTLNQTLTCEYWIKRLTYLKNAEPV
jgi:hypothetical protein